MNRGDHMRLKGKTALITGAARTHGIGRGTALALAKEGANIMINDIAAEEEGAELVREIESLGQQASFYRADVSKRVEVKQMIAETIGQFGRIDIFVNNAGVASWENVTA